MIDKHSATWKRVERFIEHELEDAFNNLVADRQSDHQRGVIQVLDRLSNLPEDPVDTVVADHYT